MTAGRWQARRVALLAALVCIVSVLSACSGVPESSNPQVIRSIGGDAATPSAPPAPIAGADARDIVEGFLEANVSADIRHTAARQYLTPDAQRRWQDSTAVIVSEDFRKSGLGVADPLSGDVTFTARRLGSVSAEGVYTSASIDPLAAVPERFTFGMKRVEEQWRIDQLPNFVLISETDFETSYQQYPIYFFDATEHALVPDMRFTATSGQSLASFLLAQLLAGPRESLATLISEVPPQPTSSNPTVTIGSVTEVDLVAIRALPAGSLQRMAAQLSATLDAVTGIRAMRLVEAGTPVIVPGRQELFLSSDFPEYTTGPIVISEVLYIRNGAVFSSVDDRALPGRLGTGELGLVSVARIRGPQSTLAAVGTSGGVAQLYISPDGTTVLPIVDGSAAQLTRPSWASAWDEVWVSDGTRLLRVSGTGPAVSVPIAGRSGAPDGKIVALRVSRDGCRIALIYDSPSGGGSVWTGTIVRPGADARVEQLTQIVSTPRRLADLAWSDEGTVRVVAEPQAGDLVMWSVQVDGALFEQRSTSGLPTPDQRPVTLTAAPGLFAWVSVAGTLWEERGGSWVVASGDLPGQPQTAGTAPAYQD